MSPVRRHSGVLITALFGAAVPHVIRGAEVAPSDAGPLEEVVVTAERRTERSLDVAASVSVIGGAEIEKLHATSLVDLAAAAPGLVITSGGSPGQTSIVLRGLPAMGSGSLVATVEESLPCCRSCYHIDTLGFALVLAAGAVEGLPSHVNQGEKIRWRVRYYSMPATGSGLHYRPATPLLRSPAYATAPPSAPLDLVRLAGECPEEPLSGNSAKRATNSRGVRTAGFRQSTKPSRVTGSGRLRKVAHLVLSTAQQPDLSSALPCRVIFTIDSP